jgi:hypothetical protein
MDAFSHEELLQLRELNMQSLAHYEKLLADTATMDKLKEGDRLALKMCLDQVVSDLQEIDMQLSNYKKNDLPVTNLASTTTGNARNT